MDAKKLDDLYDYLFQNREEILRVVGSDVVYNKIISDKKEFEKKINHNYKLYIEAQKNNDSIFCDFGCGWGFFVFSLAIFGVKNIYGIDIRREEVELAKKIKLVLFDENKITFINSQMLNIEEHFDVIYFNNVLSHVKLPISYLYDSYSKLNYAGKLIIYDHNNGLSLYAIYHDKKLYKHIERQLRKERTQLFLLAGVDKDMAENYGEKTRGLGQEEINYLVKSDKIEEYLETREKNLPPQWIDPPIIDERLLNPIIYRRILLDLGFECVTISAASYNHPKLATILNKVKFGLFILPAFLLSCSKRRIQI